MGRSRRSGSMLRIIQQLIEMRVKLIFGRVNQERSLNCLETLAAQDILKIMDETAKKIVIERISKRHVRERKEVHTHFSTTQWELPREGDDGLGEYLHWKDCTIRRNRRICVLFH